MLEQQRKLVQELAEKYGFHHPAVQRENRILDKLVLDYMRKNYDIAGATARQFAQACRELMEIV